MEGDNLERRLGGYPRDQDLISIFVNAVSEFPSTCSIELIDEGLCLRGKGSLYVPLQFIYQA